MSETIANAISQSKVVLVLLSDDYCQSDFCRLEWTHAMKKKIKVYVIIVKKDFDKEKYGWVEFRIGDEFYYKMHKKEDFPKLIEHLRDTLNKKLEHVRNRRKSSNATKLRSSPPPSSPPTLPLPPPLIPKVTPVDREYSRKTSIATWTPRDIQDWCNDNDLKKWCRPLASFDGQNLLVLRRDLSNDRRIQCIGKENTLDIFDVARFKSEVDKILSKTTTTHKAPTKKLVIKRRISKSSNK